MRAMIRWLMRLLIDSTADRSLDLVEEGQTAKFLVEVEELIWVPPHYTNCRRNTV